MSTKPRKKEPTPAPERAPAPPPPPLEARSSAPPQVVRIRPRIVCDRCAGEAARYACSPDGSARYYECLTCGDPETGRPHRFKVPVVRVP